MRDLGTRSSPTAFKIFDGVFDRWMASKIEDVRILALPQPSSEGPLLFCANHVSWWDGFLLRQLARKLRPGAPLFTVMLDREIGPRPWLRKLGAVGVTPGSTASVRNLLRTLTTIGRQHPTAVVSFFPQGRIWPSLRRPLGFEPGIGAVVRALSPVAIVPVGLHFEPGRHTKPTAYLLPSIAPIGGPRLEGVRTLEKQVEHNLNLIHAFLSKYGEEADLHPFEELL